MTRLVAVLASAALVSFAVAGCSSATPTATDESATGASEGALLAGTQVSETEAASLLEAAGFTGQTVAQMVCTAKYESDFFEQASNSNSNGTTDYGLWQINSSHLGEAGCTSSASALYDGATNARCAREIFEAQGLDAWVGYLTHKAECDAFKLPTPTGGDDDDDDGGSGSGGSGGSGTGSAGSCWSLTFGEIVPENTCIRSEQCVSGKWYYGVSGTEGPNGKCVAAPGPIP
jgi:hypothetical protein